MPVRYALDDSGLDTNAYPNLIEQLEQIGGFNICFSDPTVYFDSEVPIDAADVVRAFNAAGSNPTSQARVFYIFNDSEMDIAEGWESNTSKLPKQLADQFRWPDGVSGGYFGAGEQRKSEKNSSRLSQPVRVTLELPPLLYHRLAATAIEEGHNNISDFILEVITQRAGL